MMIVMISRVIESSPVLPSYHTGDRPTETACDELVEVHGGVHRV